MLIVRNPALLALAVVLAVLGGSTAAAAPAYRVVDASGQELGSLVDVRNGSGRVILEAGGQLAAVEVRRDQFVSSVVLVYPEVDCAGTPLIVNFAEVFNPGLGSVMRPTAVVGSTLLIATTDNPVPTAVKSARFMGLEPGDCVPDDDIAPAYPTAPLLDVGQFQAPFRIEASTGAAGRRERRAFVVRDSSGALLGPVVGGDLPFEAAVLRDAPPGVLPVLAAGSRLVDSVSAVVFTGVDCTGPPFLQLDDESVTSLFVPGGVTGTGDLLVAGGPRAYVVAQSQALLVFGVPCVSSDPENVLVQPGVLLLEAASLSPPFRVGVESLPGGSAGRSGVGPLALVDATGDVVGPAFARRSQHVQVLLGAGRRRAEVTAAGDFIQGTQAAYFELAGCEGPPLLRLSGGGEVAPLVAQTVVGRDGTLHVGDGPIAVTVLRSRWEAGTATCVEDPLAPTPAQGTSVFFDLGRFRPPFQVRPASVNP